MRKISGFAFFLAILLSSTDAHLAQTNPEADVDERYLIENVFGIVKATNGGFISGFYYRHSKKVERQDTAKYCRGDGEHVKHPREAKETTFIGSSFIYR
jgi:hypothetical protein